MALLLASCKGSYTFTGYWFGFSILPSMSIALVLPSTMVKRKGLSKVTLRGTRSS